MGQEKEYVTYILSFFIAGKKANVLLLKRISLEIDLSERGLSRKIKSGFQFRNSSLEISANPHSSTLLAEDATFDILANVKESAFFCVLNKLSFAFCTTI